MPRKQPVRLRVPWDFLVVAVPSDAAAQLQRQHAQQADIGGEVNLLDVEIGRRFLSIESRKSAHNSLMFCWFTRTALSTGGRAKSDFYFGQLLHENSTGIA